MNVENLATLRAELDHDTTELAALTATPLATAHEWTQAALLGDATAAGWDDLHERLLYAMQELHRANRGGSTPVEIRAEPVRLNKYEALIRHAMRMAQECRDTAGACRAQAAARRLPGSPEFTRAFEEATR